MRIGLFIPCYIDAFFPEVGVATLELLERFGNEVVYPRDQTCCGQPMADNGFNAEGAARKPCSSEISPASTISWRQREAASTMCATISTRSNRPQR
jgi:hypothetical protein